jgi:hypothetical protein
VAERRISTPVVVASASAMAVVGIGAWFLASGPEQVRREQEERSDRIAIEVDDRTPEAAAESFYDCWRRRRWAQASAISTGDARREVTDKIARDEALDPQERLIAERAWDALARAPMRLVIVGSENLPESKLRFSAVAEYTLVNRPYQRRVELVVAPHGDRWRVERMDLGEVLTELPPILQGGGE